MKKATSRWLRGCGLGCGVLILLALVVGTAAVSYLSQAFHPFFEVADSYERLTERFGEAEAFVPSADGGVEASRLEIFLAVREALGAERTEFEALVADFPPDEVLESKEGFGKALKVMGGLVDLLSPIGEYIEARNQALLEQGMGLGEYAYVYSLAYYSWLGHSPADGPVITKVPGSPEPLFDGDDDSTFHRRRVQRRHHRLMSVLLRNQLAALTETGTEEWREALRAEIERLGDDPGRVPWQEDLPPATAASFAPYRERFAATYSGTVNRFEMPLTDDDRSWRLQWD